jgi:hypothetical protein
MLKISEYFTANYGKIKEPFGNLAEGKTPFISSGDFDNGVTGFFDVQPTNKNVITVARTGSIGSSFFHPYSCAINSDCIILEPKQKMTQEQMLTVVTLLRKNIFRYSYARKVTPKRLLNTKITENFNDYLKNLNIEGKIKKLSKSVSEKEISFSDRKWKWFTYQEVFDIAKGHYNNRPEIDENGIPFISATENNNGITDYVIKEGTKVFPAKSITVSNDGSVGNAFYQEKEFTCSHSVNVITLSKKYGKELNQYIALFLIPLIQKEKYRFGYGFKWRIERMKESKIKLPVDKNGNPDWQFMEDYIKSLPYSAEI